MTTQWGPAKSAQALSDRLSSMRARLMHEAQHITSTIEQRVIPPLAQAGISAASIFNGIGCPLIALDQLNVPINKLYIQDWDDYAARVCAARHPGADVTALPKNAEDIREHHIANIPKLDLLIITPPCTDFSGLKKGPPDMRLGFKGPTGHLMKHSLDIIKWFKKHHPQGLYILENVVFDDMPDWHVVCAECGQPHVMNANVYSSTHRRRAFWTNIVVPDGWREPSAPPPHANDAMVGRRLVVNARGTYHHCKLAGRHR